MARIRTVKPEFNSNEGLSSLSCQAHLLAEALLCYADDEGYFNANPGLVRAGTCPLRSDFENISGLLTELSGIGYVRFGTFAGKRYGHIVGFKEHQKISHPTPSKISRLQIQWECSGEFPEFSGENQEDSDSPQDTFRPEQGTGNREQGTWNREQGERSALPPPDRISSLSERFDGAELQSANELLREFRIPIDRTLTEIAGQSLVYECDRLGSPEAAIDSMRAAMTEATDCGVPITRFWFSDQKYDPTKATRPKPSSKIVPSKRDAAAAEIAAKYLNSDEAA